MKLLSASIALLGLPSALAAVAATFPNPEDSNNATPTRPDATLVLPTPGAKSETTNINDYLRHLLEKVWQTENDDHVFDNHNIHPAFPILHTQQPHKRNPIGASPSKTTSKSTSFTKAVNTFTSKKKSTASSSSSSAPPTTAAPTVTKIAVFTEDEVAWTVTSFNGHEAINGNSLVPGGGPINIGGDLVSQKTNGQVYAGGTKLSFETVSASSSYPGASSSAAAGGGGSSASGSPTGNGGGGGGGSSSSSSGNAAAPVRTAGVGLGWGVVGAVVGAMVL